MQRPIGLIAGSGQFPVLFAKAAHAQSYRVIAAAYVNESDPQLAEHVDDIAWLHLGQIKRLIRYFRERNVDQAVMAGAIRKTRLFTDVKPDIKAVAMLVGLRHTHDDGILRAFADTMEKAGVRIRPATFLMPELLAPEGVWTRRKPSRSESKDIALGWDIAMQIGRLDIGQCVVVSGGSVLAVEAIDGTDATIQRGAGLADGHAVVVKVCKPIQDTRFDMPAVGLKTVEIMAAAGATALAVEAGRALAFDRREMVAYADEKGIAITGIARDA